MTWRDDTRRVKLVWQHGATLTARQARQARLARHVFRGVATALPRVEKSTSFSPEVFSEIDAFHKRLNLSTRALLLLRRPPCWNKHGATRTTSATRSSRRARHAQRDVTQQVEFGLHSTDRRNFMLYFKVNTLGCLAAAHQRPINYLLQQIKLEEAR